MSWSSWWRRFWDRLCWWDRPELELRWEPKFTAGVCEDGWDLVYEGRTIGWVRVARGQAWWGTDSGKSTRGWFVRAENVAKAKLAVLRAVWDAGVLPLKYGGPISHMAAEATA